MALQIIKATKKKVTFRNTENLTTQKAVMGNILQKYIKAFLTFWPTDYPELTHIEYCLDTFQLTLYYFEKEIDHVVLPENRVSYLEIQCKEILCRILQGTLL